MPAPLCQPCLSIAHWLRYGPRDFEMGRLSMAHDSTPHFHNSKGLPQIEVGSKEFMCVGALPPFDHPHIFIDMGKDNDAICPYCSTHFVFNPTLAPGTSQPLSAVYTASAA